MGLLFKADGFFCNNRGKLKDTGDCILPGALPGQKAFQMATPSLTQVLLLCKMLLRPKAGPVPGLFMQAYSSS
jgi:hypothetical protein